MLIIEWIIGGNERKDMATGKNIKYRFSIILTQSVFLCCVLGFFLNEYLYLYSAA